MYINAELQTGAIYRVHFALSPVCVFSRVTLHACRNVLMYFNAEILTRILSRFHFALSPGGVLFLGKAEMLLSHGKLFMPVDLKRRLFQRVPRHFVGTGSYLAEPVQPPQRTELIGLDRI